MNLRRALLCLLAGCLACGKPASLDGRGCPCAEGYVCCQERCLRAVRCPQEEGGIDAGVGGMKVVPSVRDAASASHPDGHVDAASTAGVDGDTLDTVDGQVGPDVAGAGLDASPTTALRYLDISVGERQTCVVRNDGSIGCWGDNGVNDSFPPAVPFKQVSTGARSSCGLGNDGSIHCWGPCTLQPQDPCLTPPSGTFTFLAGASDDKCAIALDGSLTCWGPSAQRPPRGSFQKVAVGEGFACGLSGHDVACWGASASGMAVPRQIYTDIGAAADWACGLTTAGAVACWGTSPLVVPAMTGQSAIAVGATAACSLDGEGHLSCWSKTGVSSPVPTSGLRFRAFSMRADNACGITRSGELNCPLTGGVPFLRPPSPEAMDFCAREGVCWITADHRLDCLSSSGQTTHDQLVQIFCGHDTRCGLTVTGELRCWGSETPVTSNPGPFTDVAIPTSYTVCALRSDKTIKCFGTGLAAKPPVGAFRAISADNTTNYVCALSVQGDMVCWGGLEPSPAIPGKFVALSAGEFGNICAIEGSGRLVCHATLIYDATPPGSFSQVSVSESYACGLRDGLAVCWGGGGALQRVRQPPGGRFKSVKVGRNVSCGLRPNGLLVCWGSLEWPDEPRPTP